MRHYSDHYSQKAKKEGYKARSVYKLQEMDRRYKILRRNNTVLDLGSYPGSWTQYASAVVGPKVTIVSVDIKEMRLPELKNIIFFPADIFSLNSQDLLHGKKAFDVVLSDMAPTTTGFKDVDRVASLRLCEKAFDLTFPILKTNGNFICKVLQGEDTVSWVRTIKPFFMFSKLYKPEWSRAMSTEVFFVATGKKS
ncbi:MAG: RlmE family RNA methyltransferase [Candidatus Theseobacter exili]|nr:RlmE family RNA methyltransferase [Candidatus Theseobacter exili]